MGIDPALFVDVIPEDCICCICQEVLEDPRETLSCQHAFCHVCITAWLGDHNSCPSCRCPLEVYNLVFLHRIWREKLNCMRMKCPNHSSGCDAVVPLGRMERHIDECPFVRVTCPHSPCSETVTRSHLSSHLNICDFRKICCSKCQLSFPAISVKDHECVQALREDMQQRLEVFRQEWVDCVRAVRREQRKLEDQVLQQSNEITALKNSLAFGCQNPSNPHAMVAATVPQLPDIHVSGIRLTSTRTNSSNRSPHAQSSRRDRHHVPTTTLSNLSLPRLAPLHTRMSLSRSSGKK